MSLVDFAGIAVVVVAQAILCGYVGFAFGRYGRRK